MSLYQQRRDPKQYSGIRSVSGHFNRDATSLVTLLENPPTPASYDIEESHLGSKGLAMEARKVLLLVWRAREFLALLSEDMLAFPPGEERWRLVAWGGGAV